MSQPRPLLDSEPARLYGVKYMAEGQGHCHTITGNNQYSRRFSHIWAYIAYNAHAYHIVPVTVAARYLLSIVYLHL